MYMCVCMYYMHVYVCVYVCMDVLCVCVCMRVYSCKCVYVFVSLVISSRSLETTNLDHRWRKLPSPGE